MKVIRVSKKDRFQLSSTSKGNQTKWYKDDMYIKADTMGYESISEVLVSEFYRFVDDIEFLSVRRTFKRVIKVCQK